MLNVMGVGFIYPTLSNELQRLILMDEKNIILFERYDGVRFVLERSLAKYEDRICIHASHWKSEIKILIDTNHADLLITELSKVNPDGLELSRYARNKSPELKILWITVLGCNIFRNLKNQFGNIKCVEKPLKIQDFREDVLEALKI